jgi:hypothetical protein
MLILVSPISARVITLRVSLYIIPSAMLYAPSSPMGLLFRLSLLNLTLFLNIFAIAFAPLSEIKLFSRYSDKRVSFSSRT